MDLYDPESYRKRRSPKLFKRLSTWAPWIAIVISGLTFFSERANSEQLRARIDQPIFDLNCVPSKDTDAHYDMFVAAGQTHMMSQKRKFDLMDREYDSDQRCELANEGQLPVQNLSLTFQISYSDRKTGKELQHAGAPSESLPISVLGAGRSEYIEVTNSGTTDVLLLAPKLTYQRTESIENIPYEFPDAMDVSIFLRASPGAIKALSSTHR